MTYTTYNPSEIEPKWQGVWEEGKLNVTDIKGAKRPFYNLWMFPYPSAEGLHVGHAFASTASDVYGRFKRLQGYNVFQPIGYDSFGIHSENFALKIGEHPKKFTHRATKNYERQLRAMGHMYDWSRTVTTSSPDYYKWTQWIFLQMFKKGLAYRGKALVNWCPTCKTVLSDEQVIDGKCERTGDVITKKEMEQWFFKITAYAERLLANLDNLDWTKKIKVTQRNWIGKKVGAKIKFGEIEVFTTRPDTIFGATFVVLSPGHELAGKVKTVVNPANNKEIPVFVDEYVLGEVGTGAIMGVPAYDERDRVFAERMGLPILQAPLTKKKFGKKAVTYHLRDWLISRQRYWGPPIPMISCPKCSWVPVSESDLPVLLPDISDYQPEGTGKGPLANHPEFYKAKCPKCGGAAERETDVSDTFLDSAWYELRYPSVGDDKEPFDRKITRKWLPVDMYTGGAEHAVLHLMYFRFVTMVLHDLGYLDFEEPTKSFFAHGLIIKDGAKMSKSRGNVVNPDEYIAKYGADALRLYFMFMGPAEQGGDFRDAGMAGMRRWVEKVYRVITNQLVTTGNISDEGVNSEVVKLVNKAAGSLEARHYNVVIAAMMEFLNFVVAEKKKLTKTQVEAFLTVFSVFAPHLAEELWSRLGKRGSIHKELWPKATGLTSDEGVTIVVTVNGKPRSTLALSSRDVKVMGEREIVRKAKSDEKVQKYLTGQVKKTVYVPGKIVNFVI